MAYDVVVIGAGLSGLLAACLVGESGKQVLVLEKEDEVGGRQRTRNIDGFFLDRGFQLLNPAYPSVKKHVDIDALDLHQFGAGVLVRTASELDLLAHPARHPRHLPSTLSSDLITRSDLTAFATWFGKGTVDSMLSKPSSDTSVGEAWDRAGLTGPLRTQVLEPFLAGVVATEDLSTSSNYVRFLFHMFALGRPGIPSRGIHALPRQLAARARRAGVEIRTNAVVESYSENSDGITVSVSGETISAAQLLIAVGAEALAPLTRQEAIPTRGLTTWWFRAESAPTDTEFIAVDGSRSGPILNTAVMTNVAPSYSPDGTPLVQASALLTDEHVSDSEAADHTARIWGTESRALELIARDDILHALPDHPASASAKTALLSDRVLLVGDHRATPSIDGALDAGARATKALVAT